MRRIIDFKKHLRLSIIAVFAIIMFSISLFIQSKLERSYFPNISFGEQSHENISSNLPNRERKTIFKSRNSTVKIFSMISFDAPPFFSPAIATGTYVTYKDKPYILTAAHVGNDCDTMMFIAASEETAPCAGFVYVDPDMDVMLIQLEDKLLTKIPIKLNPNLNLSKDYSIGERVYYSGYPNDSALLTIKGHISGYVYDKFLLQSYAWNGASGSGIFNLDGELIGVLSAIQISYSGDNYGLIDSIVYVAPIAEIDFASIE